MDEIRKNDCLENVSGGAKFNTLKEADSWLDEVGSSFYKDEGFIPIPDKKGNYAGEVHLYSKDGKFYIKSSNGLYEEFKY